MAYGGYNFQPSPFGFPAVSPWPAAFQGQPIVQPAIPLPPPPPPPGQEMAQGQQPTQGMVPGGPMFPNLAARFPGLAQAGQRIGQRIGDFTQNFETRHPRISEFGRNNSNTLTNIGMALLTTDPGEGGPVREAFYAGRQQDAEARTQAREEQAAAQRAAGFQAMLGGGPAPAGGQGGPPGTGTVPQIVYANQGATRNDPITPQLGTALQTAAAAAGIDRIVVTSGGQEAEGEGGERTGSSRHDHGNAADVELYVGGRLLDFSNPQDQATYARFVTEAARNGVTGIGAGADYMGNTRIHVGFGAPGVWGAEGAGANAPEWLRTAYGAGAGAGGGQAAPQQGDRNPLTPEQQQFLTALYPQSPEAAMQLYAEWALTPQAPTTYGFEEVGGTLLRTNTRAGTAEPVFAAGATAATTDDIREYEYAKQNQGYTGTLEQWITNRATASRPQYYENAYDRVTGEFNAESLNTIYQNETLAIDRMTNLGLMEQLVNDPTFYSGTGANVVEGLRRLAAAIGIANPDAAVSMETFRALANEATLDAIGGSLGVGISNADRDMIRQMVANMTFSPEGNRLLINIHQAVANRNLEIAELARQYTADPNHPRLDDGFRRMLTEWATEHPLVLPQDGGAGTPDAPRAPPQVGEVIDGYRFTGGDPNVQTNWQRVQ